MHDLQITPTISTAPVSPSRAAARWMWNILGIPVAGYAGWLVSGHVDSVDAALLGALITGVALGALQAWALGRNRPPAAAWIAATTIGLMVGLGIGAAMVDYRDRPRVTRCPGSRLRSCGRTRPSPGAPAPDSAQWPWFGPRPWLRSGRPGWATSTAIGYRCRPAVRHLRRERRDRRHRPHARAPRRP